MSTIFLIIILGMVCIIPMIAMPFIFVKVLSGLILLGIMGWLAELHREEKEKIDRMQRSLDKLRNAYNELDDQAKIIIRTDLELNRAQEELDKKINGLFTLHELGKMINATLDVNKLFTLITEPLIIKLGFEKTFLVLTNENNEGIACRTAIGYDPEQIKHLDAAIAANATLQQVMREGRSILVRNVEDVSAADQDLARLFEVISFMIVPIVIKEKVSGLIFVGNSSPFNRVREGDLDLLFILANQIAVALDNARLYEQIKRSHDELEIRVKERTKELAEANAQLVKLNKMKSDFVSAVSHELRTPLTSIKGYASILLAGRLGTIDHVQKEKLEKINKHSDALISFINELLDLARIESGRIGLKIKEIKINDVVKHVAEMISPQTDEKGIKLVIQQPKETVIVWADFDHLARVFINLLSNALKFTPSGGKISILVNCLSEEFLQVDVADTGVGVDPKDLPRLFDEFYRADNAINMEKKGTGLGLSLVKNIITAHKGKIWVASEMGKGTTFSFTLSRKPFDLDQAQIAI